MWKMSKVFTFVRLVQKWMYWTTWETLHFIELPLQDERWIYSMFSVCNWNICKSSHLFFMSLWIATGGHKKYINQHSGSKGHNLLEWTMRSGYFQHPDRSSFSPCSCPLRTGKLRIVSLKKTKTKNPLHRGTILCCIKRIYGKCTFQWFLVHLQSYIALTIQF